MKKLLLITTSIILTSCASQPKGVDIEPIDGPVLYETVDLGDNRIVDFDPICMGSLGRTLNEVKFHVAAHPIDGTFNVDCITTFIRCDQQGQVQVRSVGQSNISLTACN